MLSQVPVKNIQSSLRSVVRPFIGNVSLERERTLKKGHTQCLWAVYFESVCKSYVPYDGVADDQRSGSWAKLDDQRSGSWARLDDQRSASWARLDGRTARIHREAVGRLREPARRFSDLGRDNDS